MKDRVTILIEIIHLADPARIPALQLELRGIGWGDADQEEVAALTAVDVCTILERYIAGVLSDAQLEDWANLVECREDITFGRHDDEEVVMSAINVLANPVLEGPMNVQRARRMIETLQAA